MDRKRMHARAAAFGLMAAIVLAATVAGARLWDRLGGELQLRAAQAARRQGHYGVALARLHKAGAALPGNARVEKMTGRTLMNLSARAPGIRTARHRAARARGHFARAEALCPVDAEAPYGLWRSETRLAALSGRRPPDHAGALDPGRAIARAVTLRPNGITYNYALARSLHRRGEAEALLPVVRRLGRIWPPSLKHLEKEPFWTPPVRRAFRHGLGAAVREGIVSRPALMAQSRLFAEDGDLEQAVGTYTRALAIKAFGNRPAHLIHLGRLLAQKGDFGGASAAFVQGLDMSDRRQRDQERIFQVYRGLAEFHFAHRFFQRLPRRLVAAPATDILTARALMAQERYPEARRLLVRANRARASAPAYLWLARIAEKERDWNGMELSAQKATVLAPADGAAHLLFSRALKQQKKLAPAEAAADRALACFPKPSPWHFSHRAWIRWARKNYPGAAADWRQAGRLKPVEARFAAWAAEAHGRLGDAASYRRLYERAAGLDPANTGYRAKLAALR